MFEKKKGRLKRADWLKAALSMCEGGVDKIKVAPLAKDMGVTSGSFYWHFKNRGELLDALLTFWEQEMTDAAIAATRSFSGSPEERIFYIMETIVRNRLTRYDLAIWH